MKTAINGVRYDTDTATWIGKASIIPLAYKGKNSSAWKADLYMTPRSGKFFLFGSGGFMTRFKNKKDVFIELTNVEMLTWAKEYLPKEALHDNPDITAKQIK